MPFLAHCDFCDRPHHCRTRSCGKTLVCKDCGQPFVATPQSAEPLMASGEENSDELRPYQPLRRRKKKSDSDVKSLDAMPVERVQAGTGIGLRLMTAFGIVACAVAPFGWLMNVGNRRGYRMFAVACVSAAIWFGLDWLYRKRIIDEIESYGGTVSSIRFQVLQGMIFTRGYSWRRSRRRYRFYQVDYVDRDGKSQSDLCGISWLSGSDWDW